MTAPTIIRGMSPEDYHAHSALSRSRLKVLLTGPPRDFLANIQPKDSYSKRKGTAGHLAVIEPEKFAATVIPRKEFSGKGSVAARDAWEEENADKLILSPADYDGLRAVADLVRSKKGPAAALREGDVEVSMFWHDGAEHIKARPDVFSAARNIAVDLKFTDKPLSDHTVTTFLDSHFAAMQAAMVTCGARAITGQIPTTYLLLIHEDPPVDMRLVLVDEDWLCYGEAQYFAALKIYRECVASGRWEGWADRNVTTVPMPTWLAKRAEVLHIDNARPEEAA